jgi:ribosome-associated toxin RatA of RatAB toxin-antitoxin module
MKLLIIAIVLHLSCALMYAQNEWIAEKNESSIQTYSRLKKGKTYYETRAVFTVRASVNRVVQLVTAVDDFKVWLPHTIDSKIITRVNDSVFYGYTVSEAPWPLSDRDVYFKVTVTRNGNEYIITLLGKMNDYPLQTNKVRVKGFHAQWRISELKNGEVEIEYIASFDPDGGAPNWIIKNRLIDVRIETARQLMKQLEIK